MIRLDADFDPLIVQVPKEFIDLGERIFTAVKDSAYEVLGTVNVIMELDGFFYTHLFLGDDGMMIQRILCHLNEVQKFLIACYIATLKISEHTHPTTFGKL